MNAEREDLPFPSVSLFHTRKIDGRVIGVGFGATLGLHGFVPLLFLLVRAILAAAGVLPERQPAETPPRDLNVVEARFVKLGRPLDPDRLPDRQVPRLSTAPPDDLVVSKNLNPTHHDRPDAGPRPPDPVADLLTRLGDRAQAFAEIQDNVVAEGVESGIDEGTERTAERAGDIYRGQLVTFLRRGWSTPTVIPDAELRTLATTVELDIGESGLVTNFRVATSSGNPLFDQSVLDRLEEIRSARTPIPPPPPEVVSEYYGQTQAVRFRGRDASR